jgi:hypothetical protein
MLVRVYRTDKFDYNVDAVDAVVDFAASSLTKEKKTTKSRSTPSADDLTIYTLVNDTRSVIRGQGDEAFMVLKQIGKGFFEIMFRAYYVDFPLAVNPATDKLFWISESLGNFYFVNPAGSMVIVQNITGDRRDFNTTTSTYTTLDISPLLRNSSLPGASIGNQRPDVMDSAHAVWINYGDAPAKGCNDGSSSLLIYNSTHLSLVGEQSLNSAYWLDGARKWWVYANNFEVSVTNYETNEVIYSHTFTEAQITKIISRYSLGAWVGPLAALGALWVTITIFCAVFCRDRC